MPDDPLYQARPSWYRMNATKLSPGTMIQEYSDSLSDLSQAECISIHRHGKLVGYETRTHHYFQDIRGVWCKAERRHLFKRSKQERDINDWDLGHMRSLSCGYHLKAVDVVEAESKLRVSRGKNENRYGTSHNGSERLTWM